MKLGVFGPDDDDDCLTIREYEGGPVYAEVWPRGPDFDGPECLQRDATARVFAASYEMLEALQRAEFLMRRVSDYDIPDIAAFNNLEDAANQALAAIQKATQE
jgi:hypothetical protein